VVAVWPTYSDTVGLISRRTCKRTALKRGDGSVVVVTVVRVWVSESVRLGAAVGWAGSWVNSACPLQRGCNRARALRNGVPARARARGSATAGFLMVEQAAAADTAYRQTIKDKWS
jgi:hypothetical protein